MHEVILAVETLSRERTGALIVLEGETGLEEYLEVWAESRCAGVCTALDHDLLSWNPAA